MNHYLHYNVVMLQLSRVLIKHSGNADLLGGWRSLFPYCPKSSGSLRITCTTISGKKKSATHAKIFQITLQVVVLWDDCHSECCEVL